MNPSAFGEINNQKEFIKISVVTIISKSHEKKIGSRFNQYCPQNITA